MTRGGGPGFFSWRMILSSSDSMVALRRHAMAQALSCSGGVPPDRNEEGGLRGCQRFSRLCRRIRRISTAAPRRRMPAAFFFFSLSVVTFHDVSACTIVSCSRSCRSLMFGAEGRLRCDQGVTLPHFTFPSTAGSLHVISPSSSAFFFTPPCVTRPRPSLVDGYFLGF
jgi:hypothetical protein